MNIIVTPRLLLRPFEPADLPDVARLFADPEVMRFIRAPRTLIESEEKFRSMVADFNRDGFGMFAVVDRREKAFIGRCGLQPLPGTGLYELGYTFFPNAWGKGYATEASKAVLHRAFEEWGLDEVVAVADREHIRSIRVMEKLGMQFERNDVFYEKECVLYSIVKKKLIQPSTRPFSSPFIPSSQSGRNIFAK